MFISLNIPQNIENLNLEPKNGSKIVSEYDQ